MAGSVSGSRGLPDRAETAAFEASALNNVQVRCALCGSAFIQRSISLKVMRNSWPARRCTGSVHKCCRLLYHERAAALHIAPAQKAGLWHRSADCT